MSIEALREQGGIRAGILQFPSHNLVGEEMEMTKKTAAALRRPMIVAAGVVALAGCVGAPRMLNRPVGVQAGGLDCASATLVELRYTITDGDRATGFVRGERHRRCGLFCAHRSTDILMVSETASEGSKPQLNVTASRVVEHDDGPRDDGPSGEGLANAEQLLDRCAGRSGEVQVR